RDEALRRDRVHALAALLVRRRHAVDIGPLWPRVVRPSLLRRPRQDLELMNRQRALPMGRAEAVRAGVAAADDHDSLAVRADEVRIGNLITGTPAALELEIIPPRNDSPERTAPEP